MKKQSFFVFFFLMIISCGGYAQTAINTVDDLRAMVTNGSYYLTEDLEVADWIAFGVFTGTFDGRGHSITVLGSQQDSDGNMGFFAATNGAVISNLVISGWFKDCTGFGGSLVGRAVNTTIVNCETDAEITTNNILAISGGLVGCLDGGCIENCSSNASMEGVKMGGLAGTVENGASIRNSFSSVSVVYSSKYTTPEVGLLVYNNEGLLENNYVRFIFLRNIFIRKFFQGGSFRLCIAVIRYTVKKRIHKAPGSIALRRPLFKRSAVGNQRTVIQII